MPVFIFYCCARDYLVWSIVNLQPSMIQSESILHLLLTLQCIGEAFILIANKENYVDYLMNANVGTQLCKLTLKAFVTKKCF